jgi:WD40 repeat protein
LTSGNDPLSVEKSVKGVYMMSTKARTTLFIFNILILSALLFVNGCNSNQNEKLISKLGTTESRGREVVNQLTSYWISPDGKRIARIYVEPEGRPLTPSQLTGNSKCYIIIDHAKSKQYDSIDTYSFVFSPDSKRYAYIAKKDGKYLVVVDGVESKAYDYPPFGPDIEHPIIFSPNSQYIVYCVQPSKNSFMVVKDGVEGKQYDFQEPHGPGNVQITFSPDSEILAYVGYLQMPDKIWGYFKQVVVQNGVEGKQYGKVSDLKFSADSSHSTYVVYDGDINGPVWFRVLDGVEGQIYTSGPITGIQFSPDGKRTLILQGTLTIDRVEIDKQVNQAFFSPDSQRVAYVRDAESTETYTGSSSFVIMDDHEWGPYRSVMNIMFSPDSERLAYVASATMDVYDRNRAAMLDGQPGKPYSEITEMTFSPDSQHFAYKVYSRVDEGGFMVSDGIEGIFYSNVTDPVYSGDGEKFAYIAYKANIGKEFIVVNGIEGSYYNWVSRPAFSPDGKHLAYIARNEGNYFAVIDGVEMKKYDRILFQERNLDEKPEVQFDSAYSFHYLALSGENIYLVTETIK